MHLDVLMLVEGRGKKPDRGQGPVNLIIKHQPSAKSLADLKNTCCCHGDFPITKAQNNSSKNSRQPCGYLDCFNCFCSIGDVTSLIHPDEASIGQLIVSLALGGTCNDLQGFYEPSVSAIVR
ncbi:hypothetical protein FPSE_09892 [Fusarium pseudograminearum CS3096]|uniref:Uncharacterized protein n=1 Tax=Fusarium pseudograminearum (strain CS3096) TaxID=1028729 RepID=K3V8K8_FUSPC|nr:hypothetical protein FPSE_09892 [Fusarium pseudograminearum CS3096]EKJ69942.1 hypothetical protein FPSE_09892 [Fusarium pseudograminearum CS3096]